MTASAASPVEEEKLSSRPSPFMDSEERCLRGVVEMKGCVAKVMRRAECKYKESLAAVRRLMLSQEGSGEREKSSQSLLSTKVGVVVTVRKYDQEDISLDASWAVSVCGCGLDGGWTDRCREHGHVGMQLQQRLFVAVVCELVRDGDGIDERVVVGAGSSLAPSAHPASEHLDLAHHLLDVSYALHRTGRGMPLLREPLGHIRLPAHEPRVDQYVVVDTAAMLDSVRGPRNLEQPGRVGIQVVQDGTARCKRSDDGIACFEVELF